MSVSRAELFSKIVAQKRVRVTVRFVNTHRHRARGRGDVNPDDHFNPKYSPDRQKTALERWDSRVSDEKARAASVFSGEEMVRSGVSNEA